MSKIWSNSADAHVMEPADLWSSGLPSRLAPLAPASVKEGRYETVSIEGKQVRRLLSDFLESFRPPGVSDVALRLEDMDQCGVWGALVFPSMGLWVTGMTNDELASACGRVYNEWLASEVLSASPRLIGAAIVSGLDTDTAIADLEHARSLGFPAVMMSTTPAANRPYNDPVWDPFWDACSETGTVLAFHIGTGYAPNVTRGRGGAVINYMETAYPAMRTVSHLVASGALDSRPDLKMLIAECGCAWVPAVADRLDEAYRQHGIYVDPKLSRAPSEIVYQQVYTSFQHDRSAVPAFRSGYDKVMWGDDYPHLEGTYPRTQEILHELFDGLDARATERILLDNFRDLFPTLPPLQAAA